MDLMDQKLAAVRLLLGDDLAKELVDDQWNAVNELSDPYEIRDGTSRYGMKAAKLAARVLGAVSEGLEDPMLDLSKRQREAIGAMSEEERQAWFRGGDTPAIYAQEKCADFSGVAPEDFIKGLLKEIDEKNARLSAKDEDA
jgi:hypothetical protein